MLMYFNKISKKIKFVRNFNFLTAKYVLLESFFCSDRDLNLIPYIYYAMYLSIDLSSREQTEH